MTVQVDDKAFADLLEGFKMLGGDVADLGPESLPGDTGAARHSEVLPEEEVKGAASCSEQEAKGAASCSEQEEQVTVLILEAPKFQSFTLRLFAVRFPLRFKAASVARVILVALVAPVAHLPSSRWLSFAAPFT
ncbi:unnamed protein product [Cladocopium goreaui]|uniref:Uncharacterized protein n=1 Tax=Cladocopium goreaui TaxID=2562237 RepID=A0A9P1CWN9_9DINO|nr:unnamed protein product [Cladocopium goreaui]